MPEPENIEKALLIELDEELLNEKNGGKRVQVQFNPETLKLNFSNQISGGGDQSSGSSGRQFLGSGTTKLSLQLWFDATAPLPNNASSVDDVRKLTQEVVYFLEAVKSKNPQKKTPILPGVRFQWSSFIFDGLVDSIDESLEFFSSKGKPLRASLSLNLSQQKILKIVFAENNKAGTGPSAGTKPLTPAVAGQTLQDIASALGIGDKWQKIAEANNIENPRMIQPGRLIDMNPIPKGRLGF